MEEIMHEINKCHHMEFNKSYGCSCSTESDNMKKTRYEGYAEVYVVDVDGVTNSDGEPAATGKNE
jgi:hypothetical protein